MAVSADAYLRSHAPGFPLPPEADRFLAGLTEAFPGRFEVEGIRRLRPGSLTAWGRDQATGEPVFIRGGTDPVMTAGLRMRLIYEARALQAAPAGSFAAIVGAALVKNSVFVVSRYEHGPTLTDLLAQSGRLSVETALQLGKSLFLALQQLHDCGVRHRNVDPDNIILPDPEDLSSARLVNFGATRDWSSDAFNGDRVLDEVCFVSPEQAGTIDQDVSAPADLYAAGAVLFTCLTGHPPFQGATISDILLSHLTDPLTPLREEGVSAPRVIDEVLGRLLRKDPRDRYQTAEAVVKDLDKIQELLRAGVTEPEIVIGSEDERGTLTEPAFVGREVEVTGFRRRLQKVVDGVGGVASLEGESGSGKSRLLVEIAQTAVGCGFRVYRGRASSDVGLMPFALLDQVAERILSTAFGDPALIDRLREALGEDASALVSAFPRLAPILGEASHERGPEAFAETRTLRILRTFLRHLGSPEHPALVILDDCQWADDLTIKLLNTWHSDQGSRDARTEHVLILAAFRAEEVGRDHPLRNLPTSHHCRLAGLSPENIGRLLTSMAGQLPADAIDHVTRVANGSPFVASAALRGLVEVEALVPSEQGWKINPLAMAECQAATAAAELLSQRIRHLSVRTRHLLTIGAVLGREFRLDRVGRIADQSDLGTISALDEARQRNLVWLKPDESTCVFMHDKIRQVLLDHLMPEQRQLIHRQAAEYLAQQPDSHALDLAFHFDAAGDHERALPYAIEAATQARAQHSLEIAQQQYMIAKRGVEFASAETQFRIIEGLGDVLMLRGEYQLAAEEFEQASGLAQGKLAQAKVRGKLAELAFKRGVPEQAAADYEAALRLLGARIPRHSIGFLLPLLQESFVQVAHSLMPRFFVHRWRRPPDEQEALILRLLSGLAHSYWYARSKHMVLWAHLRELNLGERYLPSPELAQAYSEHAPVMTLVGQFQRAFRYARKSLQICRELNDLWGQGAALNYYGISLYAASRYEECIASSRESIRLLERMGDYWLVHMARYQLAASLYRLGQLDEAIQESKINYRSALEVHDEQASRIVLDIWARAGEVPEALIVTELSRPRGDSQGTAQVLLAEAVSLIKRGQLPRAVLALSEAISTTRAAGVCNAYTIPCQAWLATAYRLLAVEHTYDAVERNRLIQAAYKAARQGLRATWTCRNDLPHFYRELGLLSALGGHGPQARSWMIKSCYWAQRLQAADEQLQNLDALRQIGITPEDRIYQRASRGISVPSRNHLDFSSTSQARNDDVTLSLADRFQTVLTSGRRIAAALLVPEVYTEARHAALKLLRGDRCSILEITSDETVQVVAGDAVRADQELVQRAITTGKAVTGVLRPEAWQETESSSTARGSVLCAPIQVRERISACLYITHGSIESLFGEAEERLAEFITVIAGAACENAQGFAELRQLNVTLEDRVAERTAAAKARAHELELSNRNLERVANDLRKTEDELRVAISKAEQANEAKGRFLATMSHEIRTPLNGVLGMTEIVLRSHLSPQQKGYLNLVKQSGVTLLTLLNDILDFSKIEAGRMDLEHVAFDLHETVQSATRLMAASAYQKQLELICHVDPAVPRSTLGDPTRLRQVVANLVGNAIKFTERGHVRVTVAPGSHPTIHGPTFLRISVEDTGIGIPADKLDLIFDAFRQSDSSTTRRFGGTGLGLAISKQLVELMGGSIVVQSVFGQGTQFHCDIPFEHIDQPASHDPFPWIGGSVLLISEHATSARAVTDLLIGLGLRTTTVARWDAAPEQLVQEAHLVLYDQCSPALDAAVLEQIRAACPGRPLIRLTPPGDELIADELCDAQITKPPTSSEMSETLRRLWEPQPHQDEPESGVTNTTELGTPLKILLVDDSEVNQLVGQCLLEARGHQVFLAGDGAEAISACQTQQFDLVLMDLEMPEMDGLETTRRIRQLEHYRSTPIYALTAHLGHEVKSKLAESQLDGFLSKPFDPDQLFAMVEAGSLRSHGAAAATRELTPAES